VCNTNEKISEAKQKCGMIGWANPCISCLAYARPQSCMMQLETMSKMMLKKEWLCKLFEMLSWIRFDPLSTNCMKWTTHATIFGGRSCSPTSNGSRRGMDQKCWCLSFPILKVGDDSI
jgi:hypothetical protein